MASGRDRQGLMRSTKAGQQLPWARLAVAGEGETMREREREREREEHSYRGKALVQCCSALDWKQCGQCGQFWTRVQIVLGLVPNPS